MSRVKGRAPTRTTNLEVGSDATAEPGSGRERSRVRRVVDTTAGVVAAALVGGAAASASGESWWWAVVTPAVVCPLWWAWRWSSKRLGALTAAAALCSAAFVLSAALHAAAPNCPGMSDAGRCGAVEAGQSGFLGLMSVGLVLAAGFAASRVWSAALRVVLGAPGAVAWVRRNASRLETARRTRRDRGVRWVRSPWHRDWVVWSAAAGTAAGAVAGAAAGGVGDAATWAVGGFLILGGLPAAWRAGTVAGEQRAARRHPGRRR